MMNHHAPSEVWFRDTVLLVHTIGLHRVYVLLSVYTYLRSILTSAEIIIVDSDPVHTYQKYRVVSDKHSISTSGQPSDMKEILPNASAFSCEPRTHQAYVSRCQNSVRRICCAQVCSWICTNTESINGVIYLASLPQCYKLSESLCLQLHVVDSIHPRRGKQGPG